MHHYAKPVSICGEMAGDPASAILLLGIVLTFRFNRRRSQARGLLFHRLAQQAVAVAPAPYHTIIGAARADNGK